MDEVLSQHLAKYEFDPDVLNPKYIHLRYFMFLHQHFLTNIEDLPKRYLLSWGTSEEQLNEYTPQKLWSYAIHKSTDVDSINKLYPAKTDFISTLRVLLETNHQDVDVTLPKYQHLREFVSQVPQDYNFDNLPKDYLASCNVSLDNIKNSGANVWNIMTGMSETHSRTKHKPESFRYYKTADDLDSEMCAEQELLLLGISMKDITHAKTTYKSLWDYIEFIKAESELQKLGYTNEQITLLQKKQINLSDYIHDLPVLKESIDSFREGVKTLEEWTEQTKEYEFVEEDYDVEVDLTCDNESDMWFNNDS